LHFERAGHGPAVIFLHAGVADARMWEPQLEAFAADFEVIRPDIRGFGQSSLPPEPWSPLDDLAALMDDLQITQAHLVGCSMGGSIAIDFVLDHPDRVSKLVLVGSAVRGYRPREEFMHVFAEEKAAREAGDMQALNDVLMRMLLDGPERPRGYVAQPLRELFTAMNGPVLGVDHTRAEQSHPTWNAIDRLHEITAPTLVVVGDSDLPHVLDIARLLEESIPHARKTVIHDAAHLPNLEHPDEFNQVVLEFLYQ
jgi:pimeloyl-ACP methyl ester carboxylesterase